MRRVGPLVAPTGSAVFRQGPLGVFANPEGWSIVVDARVHADLDVDGSTSLCVVDDNADTLHIANSVVLVVAQAIVERLQGWFHVHAGLVVDDVGCATLIVGESGAGKTTTTLALAASARLLSDDVVFVQPGPGGICARGFLRPLHVGDATLAMFPALRERLLPGLSSAGKAIVGVDDSAPNADVVVVTRLVFPSIEAGPSTVAESLAPSLVLPRLLRGSAMVAWPSLPRAAEHLHCLAQLATLPGRALRLGRDALVDPGCIARVLGAASALE